MQVGGVSGSGRDVARRAGRNRRTRRASGRRSSHHGLHPHMRRRLAQPPVQRPNRRAQIGAHRQMQRIAGAQPDGTLVPPSAPRPGIAAASPAPVTILSTRGRANCGSAAARCSISIWRVRNLIDRAEEESATTQSLIVRSSRIPPQATPERARSQLHSPNAATSNDVSRWRGNAARSP